MLGIIRPAMPGPQTQVSRQKTPAVQFQAAFQFLDKLNFPPADPNAKTGQDIYANSIKVGTKLTVYSDVFTKQEMEQDKRYLTSNATLKQIENCPAIPKMDILITKDWATNKRKYYFVATPYTNPYKDAFRTNQKISRQSNAGWLLKYVSSSLDAVCEEDPRPHPYKPIDLS